MRSILLAAPAVLTVALAAAPAHAQSQDGELWLTTGISVGLSEKTSIDGEYLARFSTKKGLYEAEFGAVVTHKLTDTITLAGGFFRVPGYDHGNSTHIENRPRQQISVKMGKFLGGSWQARVRTEQRFRTDGDDVGHRVRPHIRYALPLGGKTQLQLSHESYINLNATDWGQASGYERMRNLAAVVTPIGKGFDMQIGYLNQYRIARDGKSGDMGHVLSAGVTANF